MWFSVDHVIGYLLGCPLNTFYFLSLLTSRAPITICIVFVFIPHILSISISRSLYFDKFSVTLVEMFLSVGIALLCNVLSVSNRSLGIIRGIWGLLFTRLQRVTFSINNYGDLMMMKLYKCILYSIFLFSLHDMYTDVLFFNLQL